MKQLLLLLICFLHPLPAQDNIYITGDNFKAYCNHSFDIDDTSLNPANVREGDTVYVFTSVLKCFLESIHPRIAHPYILVSHGDDYPVPGKFGAFLYEEKIIAWFGQNVQNAHHPKLHPLPIGIPNKKWWCGDIATFNKKVSESPKERTIVLYMNFNVDTNRKERSFVFDLFNNKPFCYLAGGKGLEEYLDDLLISKFVLCPRGNGLDCHRTWECLLMGAIPIVKTSDLDPLFENLPVLIVENWKEITPRFLTKKYKEMQSKTYQMEKVFIPYWLQLIEEVRQSHLSKKQ